LRHRLSLDTFITSQHSVSWSPVPICQASVRACLFLLPALAYAVVLLLSPSRRSVIAGTLEFISESRVLARFSYMTDIRHSFLLLCG
jgi:hypothetical protein